MDNHWRWLAGGLLIMVGMVSLAGTIFHINFGALCLPIGLIGVGLFLLLRPRVSPPQMNSRFYPVGEVHRTGRWQVTPEEIWIFVCDVDLDMSDAEIPTGETIIRIFGFIGDIQVVIPKDVGISVFTNAFLLDANIIGQKDQTFMASLKKLSENCDTAEKRIRLESGFFIADVKVQQLL
jgi:predicted membrane protein